MLEQLLAQLLGGQGESFGDVQSLLRLLGPLGGGAISTGGLGGAVPSSGTSSGFQSVLRVATGAGGVLGLTGLVRSLLGGNSSKVTTTVTPLRLPRYEAPTASFEEYGYQRTQGVQSVARQDEFGRSEVASAGAPVAAPGVTAPYLALDGRMLLQYSDEIAQAVRQALLYSHPLSELISE